MASAIRVMSSVATWTAFCIGTILNFTLIRFIHQKAPKEMRMYSKILLQTCYTDLLLLLATLIVDPLFFVTSNGTTEVIINGPIRIHGTVGLVCYIIWVFLVYVSLFGFVAQFIYRYYLVNRDKQMNAMAYFSMLIAILCVPLAYCTILVGEFYAFGDGPKFLDDPAMAAFLGFNISNEPVKLAAYSKGSPLLIVGMYYIIGACTTAYAILSTLGWLIHKYVQGEAAKISMMTTRQKKEMELNKQVSRILLIQASMPLTIYIPLLILLLSLVTGIDLNQWAPFVHYYYMVISFIPLFIPAAINPVVSLLTIKAFRGPIVRWLCRHFTSCGIVPQQQTASIGSKIFTINFKNFQHTRVDEARV